MRLGQPISFTILCGLASLATPVMASEIWTPEAVLDVRWVAGAQLSPDGRWVAHIVSEALVDDEESSYRTHVWLSATDGVRSFQLTRGKDDCWEPRWSPDGRWLAFKSERGSEQANIWLIPSDGGEAWQLTDVEEGVGTFGWSPDGGSIAFLSRDPESEEVEAAKKAKVDPDIVDTNFRYRHLWRVAVDSPGSSRPEPQRVTDGEKQIASFDWSPDGSRFVVSWQPTPRTEDWRRTEIALISAAGGELEPLVEHPGMDENPRFSPDGETVAFVSDRGDRSWARNWSLCLVPTAGGEVTVLPKTFDQMPGEFIDASIVGWAPDGSGVYYVELAAPDYHLYFMPVDGRSYRQVTTKKGTKLGFHLSTDGSVVAFSSEDFGEPIEIWVLPTAGGEARRVTAVNAELPDLPYSESEVVSWERDGLEIGGILHYPLEYEEGRRYPLLVNLHGGPTWAFTRAFNAGGWDNLQMFTSRGFAVLQVNPRGSDGYGKDYRFANLGDWGGGDVEDVLAGVDSVVERGIADPDRLGVFGWSYGGFLTGMTISKSRRFAAAVVGAAPTDLVSSFGTMDITGFIPNFMGSDFWQEPELWTDRSAVFHAGEITTPALIVHGEDDRRVPLGQAYQLYRSLQRAGVKTQLVVYPRSGHGVGEPKLQVDLGDRMIDWFETHLALSVPAPRGVHP